MGCNCSRAEASCVAVRAAGRHRSVRVMSLVQLHVYDVTAAHSAAIRNFNSFGREVGVGGIFHGGIEVCSSTSPSCCPCSCTPAGLTQAVKELHDLVVCVQRHSSWQALQPCCVSLARNCWCRSISRSGRMDMPPMAAEYITVHPGRILCTSTERRSLSGSRHWA